MNYKILTPLILLFLVNPLYAVDESGDVSDPINTGPSLAQEQTVSPLNVPTDKVIDSAAASEAGGKSDDKYTFTMGENWRGIFSPGSLLYPPYIASPLRPTIALNLVYVTDNDIPDSGDTRYVFRLGGRIGVFRFHPAGNSDQGFQIDLEGAFLGVFDRDNSLDNIGWDGVYITARTAMHI